MADIICELHNVNFTYRGTDKGVKDINITVSSGQCVGLLGESGCGKSTLAKCISGQLKGVSGDIRCGKIGYIFQDAYSSLNPSKKVGWLLKEVIRYNNKSELSRADELIKNIIEETELDMSVLEHYPNELSGGQRQRIAIACALLSDPDILIADEPVSALDVTVQKQIVILLKKLNQKKNLAILFISHDIKVVKELCDYIYILKDGVIVEEGLARDIFENAKTEYTASLLDSSYLTKQ